MSSLMRSLLGEVVRSAGLRLERCSNFGQERICCGAVIIGYIDVHNLCIFWSNDLRWHSIGNPADMEFVRNLRNSLISRSRYLRDNGVLGEYP